MVFSFDWGFVLRLGFVAQVVLGLSELDTYVVCGLVALLVLVLFFKLMEFSKSTARTSKRYDYGSMSDEQLLNLYYSLKTEAEQHKARMTGQFTNMASGLRVGWAGERFKTVQQKADEVRVELVKRNIKP